MCARIPHTRGPDRGSTVTRNPRGPGLRARGAGPSPLWTSVFPSKPNHVPPLPDGRAPSPNRGEAKGFLGSDPQPWSQDTLAVRPTLRPVRSPGAPCPFPGPLPSPRLQATIWSQQGWSGPQSSRLYPTWGRRQKPCWGSPQVQARPTFPALLGWSLALEAALSRQGGTGGGHSCRTPLKSVG